MASTTDAAAIQASWEEPERFTAVYDRYAQQLYRYAYQRVGVGKAEDVVAETFLAAFAQRTSYDLARLDARPWLYGILTRKLARHQRAERAEYRALERAPIDLGENGPEDEVAARVSAGKAPAALAAALGELPDRDRHVLLLIAWGGLHYEEVAAALRIPVGTVRSRLNRARRKVRQALGGVNPLVGDETKDR